MSLMELDGDLERLCDRKLTLLETVSDLLGEGGETQRICLTLLLNGCAHNPECTNEILKRTGILDFVREFACTRIEGVQDIMPQLLINLLESDLSLYNKEQEFEELSIRILATILPHFLVTEDT